ncbi:hypothetical protein [Amycolatopsis benzoatilytica]|uniref:hypothetical protein n=1 Tax=Amycolatopsis benzoatilytica TaxID=346045 RepID=UPI0003706571|nr:hypothetical protein [Amycolatopsis benzoatilytica]
MTGQVWSRRTLLGGAAGGAALFVAGCASGQGARAAAAPAPGARVMIIRHGEKPDGSGGPQGIDVNGNADSHSLTVRGWTRAGALVELFDPSTGALRDGLARPTAVYAAGGSGGEGTRPRETATPLAERLGKQLDTTYAKGSESQLAAEVSRRSEPTLISWQHEEIPALAAAFGAPAPQRWPDDRFDLVWVLTPAGSGWTLTQVPQLLLAGDRPDPIK